MGKLSPARLHQAALPGVAELDQLASADVRLLWRTALESGIRTRHADDKDDHPLLCQAGRRSRRKARGRPKEGRILCPKARIKP